VSDVETCGETHKHYFLCAMLCTFILWVSRSCRQDLCNRIETARLDRQQLTSLDMSPFLRLPNLKSLHLQHNCLTELPHLVPRLQTLCFLSVAHNRLKTLQPLMHLPALMALDASNNLVDVCCVDHFPTCLRFLDVSASTPF
jgi:hypothetical protein